MLKRAKGASFDAMALTFVRILTILISMVIYKLLAMTFSVEEYGTYSSAMLVSTTTTSLIILGLTDAINYFYAKERNEKKGRVFVYTIFLIQVVIGVFSALLLILIQKPIAMYFDNLFVAKLIPCVAFLPLLTNMSHMLQVLFVTAKKAKVLAIRNLVFAILKITFIAGVCFFLKSIYAILVVTLVLELANVLYMLFYCGKNIFKIEIKKADLKLIKSILKYSIPMAAYILTNSMSKEIGKLVIGALGTSEMLGIYSIASKELPFDILTTSFLTVLIPYITRNIGDKDFSSATNVFSKYIQITYLVTWIVAGGVLVCSEELMLILYDEKYLLGRNVFCLYIIVDMMKFASVSLIFSVTNRAKELLCYSAAALFLNALLSIVFFNIWGLIGPTIATLIITLVLSCIIMGRSAHILHTNVFELLNVKQMICLLAEGVVFGGLAMLFKQHFEGQFYSIIMFAICYSIFFIPMILMNWKKILHLLKEINKSKLT